MKTVSRVILGVFAPIILCASEPNVATMTDIKEALRILIEDYNENKKIISSIETNYNELSRSSINRIVSLEKRIDELEITIQNLKNDLDTDMEIDVITEDTYDGKIDPVIKNFVDKNSKK